ncbi:hypothetical protein Tco_0679902 [Tanacetum coccineum]|uniref:Uncharacterized protein n=1 Tax=Tanacetum coccineum TaxID=301880 RepID=A0ABQ4XJ50_9ASTR
MGTCLLMLEDEDSTPLTKLQKEILALDNVNFPPPPPMVGTPKKRNMNKFCDYHQDRGKAAKRSQGNIQKEKRMYQHGEIPKIPPEALTRGPIDIRLQVRRIHVDGVAPSETSSEVINPRVSLAPVETHPRRPGKEPMQLDDMEERQQLDKKRKPPKSGAEEKIVANDNYPEQLVTIGGGLSAECRHALIHTLRKNVDIFA